MVSDAGGGASLWPQRGSAGHAHRCHRAKIVRGNFATRRLHLAQLQDAVVCCDAEGRIVYWNTAAERIFGWKAEEVLGRDITVRFPSEIHPQIRQLITDVFADKNGERAGNGKIIARMARASGCSGAPDVWWMTPDT